MIAVKNTGTREFQKSWNAQSFRFAPGEEVTIPELAARFLFAYGCDDRERERMLVRNGWLRSGAQEGEFGRKAATETLAGFVFRTVADSPRAKPEPRKLPDLKVTSAAAQPEAAPPRTAVGRETLHLPGKRTPLGPRTTSA